MIIVVTHPHLGTITAETTTELRELLVIGRTSEKEFEQDAREKLIWLFNVLGFIHSTPEPYQTVIKTLVEKHFRDLSDDLQQVVGEMQAQVKIGLAPKG